MKKFLHTIVQLVAEILLYICFLAGLICLLVGVIGLAYRDSTISRPGLFLASGLTLLLIWTVVVYFAQGKDRKRLGMAAISELLISLLPPW